MVKLSETMTQYEMRGVMPAVDYGEETRLRLMRDFERQVRGRRMVQRAGPFVSTWKSVVRDGWLCYRVHGYAVKRNGRAE